MENTKDNFQFRTKTGLCRITEQEIVIERTGIKGSYANKIIGSNIFKILLIYITLGIFITIYGINLIISKEYTYGIFCTLFGVYLIITSLKSKNNSATPLIKRSAIVKVKSYKPIPLLIRGHFKIVFNENNVQKTRIIILPGSLNQGYTEFKKALSIMQESGVI